jgi:hypothetical protein
MKGSIILEFNIKVTTKCSILYYIKFEYYLNNEINNVALNIKKAWFYDKLKTKIELKVLPYEELYCILGYMGKNMMIDIRKYLKYKVTQQN